MVHFFLFFSSETDLWKLRKYGCGFCVWQSVIVLLQTRSACAAEVRHEPTFSCSSLVKSKTVWLHPAGLRLKPKEYLCWVNINRTAIIQLIIMPANENSHRFSAFSVQLVSLCVPFTSCLWGLRPQEARGSLCWAHLEHWRILHWRGQQCEPCCRFINYEGMERRH